MTTLTWERLCAILDDPRIGRPEFNVAMSALLWLATTEAQTLTFPQKYHRQRDDMPDAFKSPVMLIRTILGIDEEWRQIALLGLQYEAAAHYHDLQGLASLLSQAS